MGEPKMPTLTAPTPSLSTSLFALIARDLDKVEAILRQTLESPQPGVARLIAHLGNYRGKRLRPALLLLTAHASGQVVHAHHLLGAVVEMIHTATLVHDDVLDGATVRRHVKTVNAGWGNQASILLGDYLFTHAFHLSSMLDDVRACRLIGEATNQLCAGELHQICQRGNLDLSEDEYFAIIDGKTAELTSVSCRLAALFGGMDDESVEDLAMFGRHLGIAFQIADDVLDLVGQETLAGKSLGTDLEQQKLTLPIIYLLHQGSEEVRNQVLTILKAEGNHKREALRPMIHRYGGLDYARRRAEEYAGLAAARLRCLPASPYKTVLEHLTERVVHRDQ